MSSILLGASLLWVNTYGSFGPGDCYDLTGKFTGLRDTLTAYGHAIQSTTAHVDP